MLVKWDLFKDMERTLGLWEPMPFRQPVWDDRNDQAVINWTPAVDVYENKENLYLEAQLPGIEMKDVNISVTDHTLQVRGERKAEHAEKEDSYHFREARYGTFDRSFSLPSYVNPDEAKAGYDRGVLTITVPKLEKAKPRMISIEAKEQANGELVEI